MTSKALKKTKRSPTNWTFLHLPKLSGILEPALGLFSPTFCSNALLASTARAGPKIIEKYDFPLPKPTEQLDDTSLAQYIVLLVNEYPQFTTMFQELTQWMNSLPNLKST